MYKVLGAPGLSTNPLFALPERFVGVSEALHRSVMSGANESLRVKIRPEYSNLASGETGFPLHEEPLTNKRFKAGPMGL